MSALAPTAAPSTPAALPAPDVDILADVTTPGRWAFRGATDAGRDFLAGLAVFGNGAELGLPPDLGERFIASARAAGLTLGMAPVAAEPEPATMPRIERAAVVTAEAVAR